ncbi:MAG: hypothetical protein K1X64_09400 [Myxococcaceae bacterium]|nr:hypothetical protein [Myxococcaceae bacterium]
MIVKKPGVKAFRKELNKKLKPSGIQVVQVKLAPGHNEVRWRTNRSQQVDKPVFSTRFSTGTDVRKLANTLMKNVEKTYQFEARKRNDDARQEQRAHKGLGTPEIAGQAMRIRVGDSFKNFKLDFPIESYQPITDLNSRYQFHVGDGESRKNFRLPALAMVAGSSGKGEAKVALLDLDAGKVLKTDTVKISPHILRLTKLQKLEIPERPTVGAEPARPAQPKRTGAAALKEYNQKMAQYREALAEWQKKNRELPGTPAWKAYLAEKQRLFDIESGNALHAADPSLAPVDVTVEPLRVELREVNGSQGVPRLNGNSVSLSSKYSLAYVYAKNASQDAQQAVIDRHGADSHWSVVPGNSPSAVQGSFESKVPLLEMKMPFKIE